MGEEQEKTVDELETEVEMLEDRIDNLEQRNSTNRITLQSYDLRVEMSSEKCDMETITELASEELRKSEKRALYGEYQEMEEQEVFELF